jgi:co-chaperonin GroES (HSP10)
LRPRRRRPAASSSPIRQRKSRSLAAGPGKRDETGKLLPLDVKAGDQILLGKWSGTEVKIDGEDLLIMKEDDIMGVVEDAAKSKTTGSATRKAGAIAAVIALGVRVAAPFAF